MVTAVALKITGMKTMNAASAHSLMSTAHAVAIDPAFTKLIEDAINTRLMEPDSSKKENPEQQLLSNILSFLSNKIGSSWKIHLQPLRCRPLCLGTGSAGVASAALMSKHTVGH